MPSSPLRLTGTALAFAVAFIAGSALVASCGLPPDTSSAADPAGRRTPTPSWSPTPSPSSSGTLADGPGPQATYMVQPQPPANLCRYRTDGQHHTLPDPGCTPGVISPAVTQANIKTTVCVPGYSGRVRPPQTITGPEKTANAKSYGGHQNLKTAEYDHLVPISLGGDPNDPGNIWVQPNDDPAAKSTHNRKDDIEYAAYLALCPKSGATALDLRQVQIKMATDWPSLASQPAIAYGLAHGPHPSGATGS